MFKIKKGRVVSDVSPNKDGSFWVEIGGSEAVRVAYTSPSYNANQGGIFAPPTIEQEVLLFEDTNPQDNKPNYFYIATIVDDEPISGKERIAEFNAVRAGGDGQPFDKENRPVKMTLQNSDNQGISTTSELTNQKRINHVSLDAEMGSYVAAGEQGCQMVNEHLDGIVVQGPANDIFPTRSITMTSDGPIFQECGGASINLTVGQAGDDIHISNVANTPALGGCGIAAGNVRVHSKNRDITLRTGAPDALANGEATKNINIITPTAQIQVNGTTGDISIQSLAGGSINMEGSTAINLTAPDISLNGNLTMTGGALTVDGNTGEVAHAGTAFSVNANSIDMLGGSVAIEGGTTQIQGGNDGILQGPTQSWPNSDKRKTVTLTSPTNPASPTPPAPQNPVPPNITLNTYGDAPD